MKNSLNKENIEDIYPLSDIEIGMIYHSLGDDSNLIYNNQVIFSFKDEGFQPAVLEDALSLLAQKHSILRSGYDMYNFKQPVHIIYKNIHIPYKSFDISDITVSEQEKFIRSVSEEERSKPFDFYGRKPIWRLYTFKCDSENVMGLWINNHAMLDGWSFHSLITELNNTSKIIQDNQDYKPEPLKSSYKEYIVQQIVNKRSKKNIDYWKQELDGYKKHSFITDLNLDPSKNRKNLVDYQFSKEEFDKVLQLSKKTSIPVKNINFAAYVFSLRMLCYENDLTVGLITHNRPYCEDGDKILGCFLNEIPFRVNIPENISWKEYLHLIHEKLMSIYEHEMSLLEIKKIVNEKGVGGNPFFDCIFDVSDFHELEDNRIGAENINNNVPTELQQNSDVTTNTFLDYNFNQFSRVVSITFHSDIETNIVQNIISYYRKIILAFCNLSDRIIDTREILDKAEVDFILNDCCETKIDYSIKKNIVSLFNEQVINNPQKTALYYNDNSLSYQELDILSNRIANCLQGKNVKPNSFVGVLMSRGVDMIASILAILKAGAVYLPLDTNYPAERISLVLKDSGASLILTEEKYKEIIPKGVRSILIEEENWIDYKNTFASYSSEVEDLAYVMYTSGTTGVPKGVLVEQKSIIRLVKSSNFISIEPADTVLQTGAPAFDATTLEIWGALLNGATLCMADEEEMLSPVGLRNILSKDKITILWLTSSLFNSLADENETMFKDLKYLLVGGDVLSPHHINKVRKANPGLKVINGYGPTENTTFSTTMLIEEDYPTNIPIGKPISGTSAYIMNEGMQLVPIGVKGELCFGGLGLSRGYLNDNVKTVEKFVQNPVNKNEIVYRTGDIGQWLPDGNIEFNGRKDSQVKIRGYRIEIGELESQLLKHEAISFAVALVKANHDNHTKLYAYYVSDTELDRKELIEYLEEYLPSYMIPSFLIHIHEVPLTTNGKLDRKALPEPKLVVDKSFVKPTTDQEIGLVGIWSKILDIDENSISTTSDFFELGGNSLTAIQLVSQIRKQFNVTLSLSKLFESSTLKSISFLIDKSDSTADFSIKTVEKKEYYILSSAQKRLYIIQEFDKTSTAYNMPQILTIEGELNLDRLNFTFNEIIRKNDSYRTYIKLVNGEPKQFVRSSLELSVKVRECNEMQAKEAIEKFVKPFNLAEAPYLHVELLKLSESKYILMLDTHHIISDGVSDQLIIREFINIYSGKSTSAPAIRYIDYAEWQNNSQVKNKLDLAKKYWLDLFSDEIPRLEIGCDFERPKYQSFNGGVHNFDITDENYKWLNQIAKEEDVTMNMLMLSITNIWFMFLSGQDDIVLGSPVVGREHSDLQNVIGMFVNTLALRNYPKRDERFSKFLGNVKNNTIKALENQVYQFEDLVDDLNIPADFGRNPLFDILFTYQDMEMHGGSESIEFNGLKISPHAQTDNSVKFDIRIQVAEKEDGLNIDIAYRTDLFKPETISRYSSYLEEIISSIVADKHIQLKDIKYIPQPELNKLESCFGLANEAAVAKESIGKLFLKQVSTNPNNIAVQYKNTTLTYKELQEKAFAVAATLRENGISENTIVAVLTSPSVEMMIAIVGVICSGAAFLPLNPDNPQKRNKFILEDSNVPVLLGQKKQIEAYKKAVKTVISVETAQENSKNVDHIEKFASNYNADALFYMISTSGTTGNPKSVLINQSNLLNYVTWFNTEFKINNESKTVLTSSYAFDLGYTSIFPFLTSGGQVHMMEKNDYLEPDYFLNYLTEKNISFLKITPSLFSLFANHKKFADTYQKDLNLLLLAGESLNYADVNIAYGKFKSLSIINSYGPAEAAISSTFNLIEQVGKGEYSSNQVIGKPIQNTKVYIVDKDNKVVPVGVAGELCISGDGVGPGYLNNPDVTASKYIQNPYIKGAVLYKTGDLAKWLPDETIEFLGRKDNQVKIRGHRIETQEIEQRLASCEIVGEAVVLVKGDSDKQLIAYLTLKETKNDTAKIEELSAEIESYLQKYLPDYMIPSQFVCIPEIPLTSNNKINKAELLNIEIQTSEVSERDFTKTEHTLATIWSQLLNIDISSITPKSNFFKLGGHSLRAVILKSKLSEIFDVELPLLNIFTYPVLENLSKQIDAQQKAIHIQIPKAELKDYYSLSSAQKRMYILQLLEPENTVYNMPQVLEIEGDLDIEKLKNAFHKLIMHFESFRTSIEVIDDKPYQKIHSSLDFEVSVYELDEAEAEQRIETFVKPFNLSEAPLIHVELLQVNNKRHVLLVDMHHIISDGVSAQLIIENFVKAYEGKQLGELRIQYADFAEWQESSIQQEKIREQEAYWLNKFSGDLPQLQFPTDYPRPAIRSSEGDQINVRIEQEEFESLKQLAQNEGVTLYMLLLGVYKLMLMQITNNTDIIVGSPIAGRKHIDLEKIVGMFVNTVAIRSLIDPNKSFSEFLQGIKNEVINSLENQDYQFETLIEKLGLARNYARNPLFDTMFVLQNTENYSESGQLEFGDIILNPKNEGLIKAKFDLMVMAMEESTGLDISFTYSTGLFKKDTIKRFSHYYTNLLKAILKNPSECISNFSILPKSEEQLILKDFSGEKNTTEVNQTIIEVFAQQVKMYPEKTAITTLNDSLSYVELDAFSNAIAMRLLQNEVKPFSIVAVLLERDINMIATLLAILKVGATYLPLDSNYPQSRICTILDESKCSLIMTQKEFSEKIPSNLNQIDLGEINEQSKKLIYCDEITIDSPAYIMYTSGTTGVPKGVIVEQKSILRLVKSPNYINFKQDDIILQTGAPAFDASTFEIWGALLNGGSLYLVDDNTILDPNSLKKLLENQNVSILWLTSSLFNFMADKDLAMFRGLRYLLVGGDVLSPYHINRVLDANEGLKIINGYGPTENTTFSVTMLIEKNYKNRIPIGKPINDTTAYILNDSLLPVPVGTQGELYLGGKGLSRGYLNQPELTNSKFIQSPFASTDILYKTGDICTWLPDGTIDFIGRIDKQVKIRGFRIELSEIENQLLKHEAISEAYICIKQSENGDKKIGAYYVATSKLSHQNILEFLKESLPDYMLPSFSCYLDKFPLTPNGKLDVKSLPDFSFTKEESYVAPKNDTEQKVVEIYSNILSIPVDVISTDTSFFELGGHSLSATMLVSKIYKELNVQVPLMEVFISPSVQNLSAYISAQSKVDFDKIIPVEKKEYYPLSSAQKRMYILQALDPEDTSYNMPQVLEVHGTPNIKQLKFAANQLVRVHESFRTSIHTIGIEPVQRVHEKVDFEIPISEIREAELNQKISDFVRPFDLEKAPFFRFEILLLSDDRYYLLIDMHHVISDGISNTLIIEDFIKSYAGNELSHSAIHYKDYSVWQNSRKQKDIRLKQKQYWLNQFNDDIPVLDIPTDLPRPLIHSSRGDKIEFNLSGKEYQKLFDLAKEEEVTPFMIVLAIYNVWLMKLTGQEDIIVGTPVAGRNNIELEKTIGVFINTLAIRSFPQKGLTFREFLYKTKDQVLNALQNQGYQFEDLVNALDVEKNASRNALFDTMLSYHSTDHQRRDSSFIEFSGLKLKPIETPDVISRFDLDLTVVEDKNTLNFSLVYCADLFKSETVNDFVDYLKKLLKDILKNIDGKIGDLQLTPTTEIEEMLEEYNAQSQPVLNKNIVNLFSSAVKQYPNNIAISYESLTYTYSDFNKKANIIAQFLIQKGIGPNSVVAILTDRSPLTLIAIYGVLKAGAAYLPLNSKDPQKRIAYLIQDSTASVVLVDNANVQLAIEVNNEYQIEDVLSENKTNTGNPKLKIDGNVAAYIIYTSGSTGKPKGTIISHKSLADYLITFNNYYNLEQNDIVVQQSNIAFDVSVEEIYPVLLVGGKLVISTHDSTDVKSLAGVIQKEQVTIISTTPLIVNELNKNVSCLQSLRYLISGGDVMKPEYISNIPESINVFNTYGPTECTVCITYNKIDLVENCGIIGKPISNRFVYIMDSSLNPLPPNVPGELCVSGIGLATGYLNDVEQTSQRFVINPFTNKELLYKTGDKAMWLPDGNIKFLGRLDNQIEIGGYRIELGEIENKLLTFAQVEGAFVKVIKKSGNKFLCAYLTGNKDIDTTAINNQLQEQLPSYMIPEFYIQLSEFPLTANGKVNTKSLPEPEGISTVEFCAPGDEVEKVLAGFWAKILSLEENKISINDNFFYLGGNSLDITVLISLVHKTFNTRLSINDVFSNPTLERMAIAIKKGENETFTRIKKVEKKEFYSLSSAQRRLYIIQSINLESTAYNMPECIEIEGKLDIERLKDTFNTIVARHESLRTSIKTISGVPKQVVHDEIELDIPVFQSDEEIAIREFDKFVVPFDLSMGPFFRAQIHKVNENKHFLFLDTHHIISDGVSVDLIFNEFRSLYTKEKVDPVEIQYKDYSEWQSLPKNQIRLQKQGKYWKDIYKEEIPVLNIPLDNKRPAEMNFEGAGFEFSLDLEISQKLQSLAKEKNMTLYMVLMAIYNVFLHKITGQKEIVVGSVVAGRQHQGFDQVMGMFVNSLAIKHEVKPEYTASKFIEFVRDNMLEVMDNQDYPFEELVDDLKIDRNLSRNPLFDTVLLIESVELHSGQDNENHEPAIQFGGLKLESFNRSSHSSKFDLSLTAFEGKEILEFCITYQTSLFTKETIQRFSEFFKKLANEMVQSPDQSLQEINILSKPEEELILNSFREGSTCFDGTNNVVELFLQQVEENPGNNALTHNEKQLSYKELNILSNQIANCLTNNKVKPGSFVGIIMDKSVEMIASILAILKTGAIYVPLDTSMPKDRIKLVLNDSAACLVLTQEKYIANLPGDIIALPIERERWTDYENNYKVYSSTVNDLAYVMYTSGTTGVPKGVLVEHKSIVRLVKSVDYISIKNTDTFLQTGAPAFDASTLEVWGALLNGANLCLPDEDDMLNPDGLANILSKNRVTILWLTSSLFNYMADENERMFKNLHFLLVGGDVLSPYHINKVRNANPDLKIINGYGPTENTTFSATMLIEKNYISNIPIGKPINGTTAYILTDAKTVAPIGIEGELYFGGLGVSRGYLNDPVQTNEKFIVNPLNEEEMIYKTGDIGRWLPDGNIEFVGRKDSQVKIRGFRIELGEIESALLTYSEISAAVVTIYKSNTGNKDICAYYISETEIDQQSIKTFLKGKLPDYMVPTYLMKINAIPLRVSGKTDFRALPEPKFNINEFVSPKGETEIALAEVWARVLGIEANLISSGISFFEIGGNSLTAVQLISFIHKRFSVSIALKDVFHFPTLAEQSKHIKSSKVSAYSSIKKAEKKEYYDLSSAQHRMYIIQQLDPESTAYNMPLMLELEGDLDVEKLEYAYKSLVKYHESFRTKFQLINDVAKQFIVDDIELDIEVFDVSQEEADLKVKGFVRPFDLSHAPLLRVELLKISEKKYYLLTDMHHIISDGISDQIMMSAFLALYNGNYLAKPMVQYKDFAQWQNSSAVIKQLDSQKQFWLNQFTDEIPVIDIPSDYPRPENQTFNGDSCSFTINLENTKALSSMANQNGYTMYSLLLGITNIWLMRLTNQNDFIIGTPVAGRKHSDLSNTIGFFVNTLSMRNRPQASDSIINFLSQVHENVLDVLENQDFQFEDLLGILNVKRDLSRNPLFDVLFSYQQAQADEVKDSLESMDLDVNPLQTKSQTAKFDISLYATEVDDGLSFNLEYNTDIYKKTSVQRFINCFKLIVEAVINSPKQELGDITILSQEEQKTICVDFNPSRFDYPKGTILDLFAEKAQKYAANKAIIQNQDSISYSEFDKKSDGIAANLITNGVKKGEVVAVMADRSIELMIGIFGILKSGGIYLPINTKSPANRIDIILNDSKANAVLAQEKYIRNFSNVESVINLDDENEYSFELTRKVEVLPNDIAYIIYTSGSTGVPKGVLIQHDSLLNVIFSLDRLYPLGGHETYLFKTPYVFDVSISEIFGWFLHGGKLAVLENEEEKDPEKIIDAIDEHNITHINFVPSMFNAFLDYIEVSGKEKLRNVKYFFIAGEAILSELINKYRKCGLESKLENIYGPTESTIYASYYSIDYSKNYNFVPIGIATDNVQLYILNERNKVQPIGVVGELCIAGKSLARGYINSLELTTQKFVVNPFEANTLMYKTGDLARWTEEGTIEFFGRIDNQVKIRGYRIELGDIESAIIKYKGIKEAVVLTKQIAGSAEELVAYYVSDIEVDSIDISEFIENFLPSYMVPAYFVRKDAIPHNSSGKVNRKILEEEDVALGKRRYKYEAPENEVQQMLAEIIAPILGVKEVGIKDNFFEYGGDSIKAIQVVAKIGQHGYKTAVIQLFKFPTIKELATKLSLNTSIADQSKIVGEVPLSPVQKWFLNDYNCPKHHFNQSTMLEFSEKIDDAIVQQACELLIEHHDILRSTFSETNGQYTQTIQDNITDFYKSIKINTEKAEINSEISNLANKEQSSFTLDKGPLIKFIKYDLPDKDVLHVIAHHLVIDGVSWRILSNDFQTICKQLLADQEPTLPLKTNSYKDWSLMLEEFGNSQKLQNEFDYWVKRDIQTTILDSAEYTNNVSKNVFVSFSLDENETELILTEINKLFNTQIDDILLAAFSMAFKEWNNAEKIRIDFESHGRTSIDNDLDVSNTVGWFTSIYPIVFDISDCKDIKNTIISVKEEIRAVPNHGIGYGVLRYNSDMQLHNKSNISYNYLGQFDSLADSGLFKVSDLNSGNDISLEAEEKYMLNINGQISDKKLKIVLYSNKVNQNELQIICENYKKSLVEIIRFCTTKAEAEPTPSDFDIFDMI